MADTATLWDGQPAARWIERLDDPDGHVRWQAVDALRHIAEPALAVPLFVGILRRGDDGGWRARALAAHALYDMAFEAECRPLLRPAVGALAEALDDPCLDVAHQAAWILELLGPAAAAAGPALRRAIDRGDEELSAAARGALAAIEGGDERRAGIDGLLPKD